MMKMDVMRKMIIVLTFTMYALTVNAENKVNVFVSILPQQYFVQQVGAEHVDVHVMVGPGQNPATYEPTPQQMASLAKADIYYSIGVPFEKAWLDKIKKSNDNLIVIECCKSISNIIGHSHHNEHHDPHVWTSPKKVIHLVKLITESLIEIDKKNIRTYEKLASVFIYKLNNLDNKIKIMTADLNKRHMIVSHPSWSYFAEEYGFSQISIEQEGKEIQAKSMVKLIKLAKEKNIKAVFVQPQFNSRAAKVIAKEIDGNNFEIDPLAFDYINNMNDVTDKIVKGLSHE
jgi:zinc transport system substrate-binding protein